MSEQELTTKVSIGDYVPSHLIVVDDGKHIEAVSTVFSSATVELITESYGDIIGVYARADGMVTLLIPDTYVDLEKLVNLQEDNEP
jgi:hypothetical protein